MRLKLEANLDYVERCDAKPRNKPSDPTSKDDLCPGALRQCQWVISDEE